MQILTFNINNSYRDVKNKAMKIIELILETDPEIIGLQEVIPDMYDILFENLNEIYDFSNKKTGMFFNLMMTKYSIKCDIKTMPFVNTSMNRDYIVASSPLFPGITFVTTHLESAPSNSAVREKQLDEILETRKNIFLFGDLNFVYETENVKNLKYLKQINDDIYTYDCDKNPNAYTYRTNLDRFYSDLDYYSRVKVFAGMLVSDHFPVLLSFYYYT